jgi:DNA-binding CsgD family transcriptional regulator
MSLTGGRPGVQAPYLAREIELERIQHRLELAHRGHGGLLILRGPAGMGTTRTAHEAAARADRLGTVVLWGRWFEQTCSRPYGALAEAFEEWAAGVGSGDLARVLAGDAPALVRLAPRLSQSLAELRPAAPLDALDEWLRLRGAYLDWLARASAETPLLVVLDDLGWVDADGLRLLRHVVRYADRLPLLIIATEALLPAAGRDPSSEPPSATLADLAAADVVDLPGLDEGATAAALSGLVDRPLSAQAVALIQEVTGGEPLWARELLRHLHAENRLDDVGGRGLPSAGELPETFEQLVAWRISRLGPEVRAALTTLAAFHDGAPPVLLAEVSGLSRSRLVEYLEIAVSHGLARSTSGGQAYVVTHDRLRLALLGGLSPIQRAQLHRRLAEALEAELGGRVRERAGELLHHYRRSVAFDRTERGVRHAVLAAEQARAAYAFLRAADCLAAGVELTDDVRTSSELAGRLGTACAEAGLIGPAIDAADEALRTQRQAAVPAGDAVDQLVATLRALRRSEPLVIRPEQEELRRRGLEYAGRVDAPTRARLELLAEAWQVIDSGEVRLLDWSTVTPATVRALSDGGNETDLAELLVAQRPRGRDESALAARHARAWRQPAAVLRAMRAVVVDLVTRHGLLREGGSWAGMYLANSERYGSPRDVAAAHILRARCQAALGLLSEAADSIEAARGLLEHLEEDEWLPAELLLSELVHAYYVDGDWTVLAERAADFGAEPGPLGAALAAGRCLADSRSGNEEHVRALLPDVLEACAQLAPLAYARDAALVDALSAAWELGAAEYSARGRSLIDLAVAGGVGTQATGSLRQAKARMYGLAGDVAEARSYFAEERPALEAAGLRPLRAILEMDEGLVIAAAKDDGFGEAAVLLEQAAEQFEALGMSGWLQRARSLLDGGLDAALRPGGRLHFTYPRGLSRREADAVRLLAAGVAPARAADQMGIDEAVLARHLAAAMDKLEVTDQADLPRTARRYGLGGGV